MTEAEIRRLLIERLAKLMKKDPKDLERELSEGGPELPADSHRLVRVVPKVAAALGIKVRYSKKLSWAFKSIESLTSYLYEEKKRSDSVVA